MTQAVSLSEAEAQLAGLVHAAESGAVVHISRHGKAQGTRVWEAIAQWRRAGRSQHGDDWPGDLEIQTWRDRSVGREVELG